MWHRSFSDVDREVPPVPTSTPILMGGGRDASTCRRPKCIETGLVTFVERRLGNSCQPDLFAVSVFDDIVIFLRYRPASKQ
jgi:hypothetical protein